MEYDASVSLDDSRHRVAKCYGGITTCAIDLAKIGRLYLNRGNWNGRQIVDTAWVERVSAGTISTISMHIAGTMPVILL